jgi:hypothetical protein
MLRDFFPEHLFFRIIAEKMQKYLDKESKTLLQNGAVDAIILMYESRKCERGGNASLFC